MTRSSNRYLKLILPLLYFGSAPVLLSSMKTVALFLASIACILGCSSAAKDNDDIAGRTYYLIDDTYVCQSEDAV